MKNLLLNEEAEVVLKSKEVQKIRYKKKTIANNKKDIQSLLDESVVIEILEQINYSDGLEGATVRFRFNK